MSIQRLTPKQPRDAAEIHAARLLQEQGYTASLLENNAPTYDIRASKGDHSFYVSVKIAKNKQHVRLGSRRSVQRLSKGSFIFAFMPAEDKGEITKVVPKQYRLVILPAELARTDSLKVHDAYHVERGKNPDTGFSVMVKGYGSHHKEMWPQWLEYTDAWHKLSA